MATTSGETDMWTLRSLARERCAVCGTHVFAAIPAFGQHAIKSNLLPEEMFKPAFHIHCRRAVLPVEDDLPHFAALPAALGAVEGGAFDEDGALHIVPALADADVGQKLVEQVAGLGEGLDRRREMPQVMVRIADRQVGFEDLFLDGPWHGLPPLGSSWLPHQ